MAAEPRGGAARPVRARLLVVEAEAVVQALLERVLSAEGYAVEVVGSGDAALERLGRQLYDLVLLDLDLPGGGGLRVLSVAPALQTDAQFVVMAAFGSVDTAVEAMKLGALDYLNKPFRTEELLLVLDRAVDARRARTDGAEPQAARRGPFARIVGEAPPMLRVFELVERVAPTRSSVVITGETGTGKELFARAVHDLSPRAGGPFIPVNCSALAENLLESELFGHVKGSFTGAIARKRGLIEDAGGGTLFLDEIATLSLPTQVKLLRVLQERQIRPIGSNQPIAVDFRLVAATNEVLEREVKAGRFRADLHFRLNVFPIQVPPLRERRSDIPLLVQHFAERVARENGLPAPRFTPETLARMMDYPWPGNVRELENFVERAIVMHAGAPTIPCDLPGSAPEGEPPGGEADLAGRAERDRWPLSRLEREHILSVLRRTRGHRSAAAAVLGVHPRTLTRKLRQYAREGVLPADVAVEAE
jgi:two-component system, NtrC family, response regulator PilR